MLPRMPTSPSLIKTEAAQHKKSLPVTDPAMPSNEILTFPANQRPPHERRMNQNWTILLPWAPFLSHPL
eukprot:c20344_g2_i1 orf=158-364(-)